VSSERFHSWNAAFAASGKRGLPGFHPSAAERGPITTWSMARASAMGPMVLRASSSGTERVAPFAPAAYLAYIDESGEVGRQGTTHFVLIAFAIPAGSWKAKDREIERLKVKYRIPEAEAHTAFMARRYIEQEHIPNFATLSDADRRAAVAIERKKALAQTALRGHDAVKAMVKT
jgi:hypothetical protein